jgi:hypothetical protein
MKKEIIMKAARLSLVLGSLGSLFIAVLPAFIASNRRLYSGKKLREVQKRLDVFGSR